MTRARKPNKGVAIECSMLSTRAINGVRNKLGVSRITGDHIRAFVDSGCLNANIPNFGKGTAAEILAFVAALRVQED